MSMKYRIIARHLGYIELVLLTNFLIGLGLFYLLFGTSVFGSRLQLDYMLWDERCPGLVSGIGIALTIYFISALILVKSTSPDLNIKLALALIITRFSTLISTFSYILFRFAASGQVFGLVITFMFYPAPVFISLHYLLQIFQRIQTGHERVEGNEATYEHVVETGPEIL